MTRETTDSSDPAPELPYASIDPEMELGPGRSRWRLMAVAVLFAAAATGVVAAIQWKWLRPQDAGKTSTGTQASGQTSVKDATTQTGASNDAASGKTTQQEPAKLLSGEPSPAQATPGASGVGASRVGASATGASATGASATGASATGANAAGDWSRAERLAALSAAARTRRPVEALLLAVESERVLGERATDTVARMVEQALRDAVDHCSGFALAGHRETVRLFASSPDGQRIVTVADQVRGWELSRNFGPIPGPQGFRVFALPTSQPTTALPTPQPTTSQPTTPQPTTSQPTTSQPTTPQPATSLPATTAVRFTSDGGGVELVTAAGEVWWWEWSAPEQPARIVALPGVQGPLRAAVFCEWPVADSAAAPPVATETAWLTTCDARGAVAVWRINAGGTVERRAALTSGGVRSLSLSGNGRYLATAGGVAQVWDLALANVPLRATLLAPQHFEFNRIAASIAGDWIAAVDVMDNLFVWRWRDRAADVDASTAPPVPTPREAAATAAATGAGERVAESVAVRPVVVDPQPELAEGIGGAVSGLAIDPEARWVAVSSLDRAVRVFHLEADNLERAVLSHNAPVRDVAVGPTGEWLFSRCEDGTTLVWEMSEERLFDPRLNLRPAATLGGVAGDSRVSDGASGPPASGSAEVAGGSQTSRIASGFSGSSGAASLVFSRSGGWLSSLEGDGQVRGWVVGAGNGAGAGPVALPLETLSLPGGPWKPLAWAVSPRGDRVAALIAGSADAARSIEVWRIDTGRGFVLEQALRVDMAPAVASALADALPSPGAVELVFSGSGDALALLAAAPENGSATAGSANSPSRTATGSPSSAEGMIGHVSLWRIADTDLATRLPRASDFQLSEPLRDLRFGANWLLGLTPNGRLRIWSRSANGPVPAKDDGEAFVEQQVATHAPARELRLSPRGQRLALLHEPTANRNAAAVISVWGPPAEAVGEWTQTGSWECTTALPTFVLGDRWLIVGEQVAPGDSRLRGFSVAGGPAKRWELRYPVLPEFRVSRDGERLLAIAAGVARLYEVAETPRERTAVRLWADAIGGLRGDSDAAASTVDSGQAGERPRVWSWSPDGRWFAVVDGGAVVWWDFDAGAVPPRQTAELSLEQCQRLFFDSHSDFFIALDERGVARVCPTRRGDWVVAARRAAGRNFTLAEWDAAGARRGEPYRETFPGWGAGVVAARTTPRPDAVDTVRTDVPIAEETDGRRTLRYHLESLPMLGEADKAAAIVREAWRAWEAAGPLRAVEVSAAERPHVVVRAERLDGPAGAPAHGQLGPPRESVTLELRLDAEQTWTEDLLRLVATHELGHLLGLGHTATPGQLMSDSVPDSVRTPQAEDIQRLRAMWSRSNGR